MTERHANGGCNSPGQLGNHRSIVSCLSIGSLIKCERNERVMDDRHVSDYDVEAVVEPGRAMADVEDARQFVQRVERLLTEEGWL
jgi:hypothetical protein